MNVVFKPVLIVLVALLTGFVLTNCGNTSSGDSSYNEAAFVEQAYETTKVNERDEADVPADYERKLIKRGNLSFETNNVSETNANIKALVAQHKGYISNENANNYSTQKTQTLEIRVPSNQFDVLVADIAKGVKVFDSKTISVEDVSEEFYDVQARLKTKKAVEANYLEILKKAKTVEDILSVERELGYIRSDIESIEGRLRYLNNQIGLSTLTVTFYETTHQQYGFFSKIVKGFKNGWSSLLSFLIALVTIWPAFIIIPAILFVIVRWRKRKMA